MKMEEDGRAYYLEYAEKEDNPALKKILSELADDELRHFNIFKALRKDQPAEYTEADKTTILSTFKNVFETLRAEDKDLNFKDDTREVWEVAREIEKKAEAFYRDMANEINDARQKAILQMIADEEHRHWVSIENVIRFLDHPRQWLADAEWNKLED
jgi:rubrerythrin